MKKSKIQKFMFVGLLIVLAVLVPTKAAYAANPLLNWIGDVSTDAIVKILVVVADVFSKIGGVLFVFAAHLANFVLGLNYNVYDVDIANPTATPTTNMIVSIGWRITRDITNLGFVLVIIVIALATILRREEYGMQKLLPKLIAAAILVNFSLTIAGVFVDFSHVLTKFFFDKVSLGGSGGIADVLAGAFQPQSLFQTDLERATSGTSNLETMTSAFLNLVFVIVFTLVGAFTILAFAFLLLLRYLHLSFLGVIAPVVWLFWVIPQLSGQFGKWWSSFLRWTFFAPTSAFFMYLALSAVGRFAELNNPNSPVFGTLDSSLGGLLAKGANIIVVTGMMLGALIIADKMGVKGASGAMALGGKMSGAARAWMGAKTVNLGKRGLTAGISPEGKTWGERIAGAAPLKRLGINTQLRNVVGIGAAFRGLSTVSSKAKESMGKGTEKKLEGYKTETKENMIAKTNAMGRTIEAPPEDLAAAVIATAEKGVYGNLDEIAKSRGMQAVRRTGKSADLLKYRPDLAMDFEERKEDEIVKPGDEDGATRDPDTGKTAKETKDSRFESRVLEKWVGKLEDPTKLDAETLAKIAPHLRPGQIEKVGKEGSFEQKERVSRRLEGAVGAQMKAIQNLNATLDNLTKEIDDAKVSGVDSKIIAGMVAERKTRKGELTKIIDALNPDESRALRTHDTMAENVNWKKFVTKGTVLSSTSGTTTPPPP